MPVPSIHNFTAPSPVGGRNRDKLNRVDFHWFVLRSLPHQERKLADLFLRHRAETPNILEVYCPTHTTVSMSCDGTDVQKPLFAGYVFVLATQQAVSDFMGRHYPDGTILYERRQSQRHKPGFLTIPEEQMRAFKDFNENYAEHVIILERPFSDYAFNPKTGEPNEIVRVLDGPLAGREGYITRFRRDKRLVFNMKTWEGDTYYAVSIPHAWNFRVVRLHNAEGDRQTIGTRKERAADLLIGLLQGCGYGDETLSLFYRIVDALVIKPSLLSLCRTLSRQHHEELSRRMAQWSPADAELLINLIRYERDNPGYVREHWQQLILRPFLTPTSGVAMEAHQEEAVLQHTGFTELIRKTAIAEEVYYPSKGQDGLTTTTYYAHIGVLEDKGSYLLFANWDTFLGEYFLTAGKANEKLVSGSVQAAGPEKGSSQEEKEKLIDSFRNYAPTFYKVLTDGQSAVKVIRDFPVGDRTLNVLAVSASDLENGKNELIQTGLAICREISRTTHLAVWRRFLRTVWLHT